MQLHLIRKLLQSNAIKRVNAFNSSVTHPYENNLENKQTPLSALDLIATFLYIFASTFGDASAVFPTDAHIPIWIQNRVSLIEIRVWWPQLYRGHTSFEKDYCQNADNYRDRRHLVVNFTYIANYCYLTNSNKCNETTVYQI